MTHDQLIGAIDPPRTPLPGKLRIAIVTPDILGPVKNGGVGTAYWEIATLLARAGHGVTIFFTPTLATSVDDIEKWQNLYLSHGIALLPGVSPVVSPEGPLPMRRSYAIYEQLRRYVFDVIHFPDMHGLGYYSIQAKKAGLDFQTTVLAVQVHGPNSWHLQFNEQEISTEDDVLTDYMERKSIELADQLIISHPSVLKWLESRKWEHGQEVSIVTPPCESIPLIKNETKMGSQKPNELVFFGRIETRKGVRVFCDALDRVALQEKRPLRVTFLGKAGIIASRDAVQYVRERSAHWPFPVSFLTDYDRDSALKYLQEGRKVALLPYLAETFGYTLEECLRSGMRFIASDLPVFVERVEDKFRLNCFFDGTATDLAAKIQSALETGIAPAQLKKPVKSSSEMWLAWHDRVARTTARAVESHGKGPLVSVCISHRNRSEHLSRAIQSIMSQTYSHFEVVVSDDGSDSPAAKSYLDSLEKEFAPKGWKVLRHPERTGPGACRNRAVLQARGEYVLLMDDDNIAKSEELETFVEAAQRTNSDVLTCFFDRVFEKFTDGPQKVASRWLCLGDDLSSGFLMNVFGDMNAFIRRSAYLKIGGVSEVMDVGGEDWAFFVRAVSSGMKLGIVPKALFYYLDHVTSYTRRIDAFRSRALIRDTYSFPMPAGSTSALMSYFSGKIVKDTNPAAFASRSTHPAVSIFGKVNGQDIYQQNGSFQRVAFDLHAGGSQSALISIRQLAVYTKDSFIELHSQGDDPGFEIVDLDLKESSKILVEVDIESHAETIFQLFYRSGLNPEYEEEFSVCHRLTEGLNVIRLVIQGEKLKGPMRIDPAQAHGSYFLRRLIIRCEI